MHILIYVLKIFNCRISFKLLFSMCLGILENELLTQLWSSNFPNSTFEKITITVAEDALILVFFPNVGFKQNNNKKHRIPWHLHTIQKSDLLKTRQLHFSLVWVMQSSMIYPCFDKGNIFCDNSNLTNLVGIQNQHENGKLMCVSHGLYTLFRKTFLLAHTALLKCFICSRVGILDCPWVQQFLPVYR